MISSRDLVIWSSFDAIKKAFSLGLISLGFPLVFDHAFQQVPGRAEMVLAVALLLGNLCAGLYSPVLGRYSGKVGAARPIRWLVLLTSITIAGAAWILPNHPVSAAALFAVGFAGFQLTTVLYDSLLVFLSPKGERGEVSSRAWAFGFGGSLSVLAVLWWSGELNMSVFSSLVWFILTVLVVLGLLLSQCADRLFALRSSRLFTNSMSRRLKTAPEISPFWVLILMFFVYDGIETLTAFVPLFAKREVGLSLRDILFLLLIMQSTAIPATLLASRLLSFLRFSTIVAVFLIIWIAICTLLSLAISFRELLLISVVTGIVIGSTKAILRAWLAEIVPVENAAQVYGWSGAALRSSAILGPALFACVSAITGSMSSAFLANACLFGLALCVVYRLRKLEKVSSHEPVFRVSKEPED